MTSDKQIGANQRNATESTGPKTAHGKALARLNAAKHGLYSDARLLPDEDRRLYRKLAVELSDFFGPVGPIEETLTDQILGEIWRLKRCERAERSLFERFHEGRTSRILRGLTVQERDHLKPIDEDGARESPGTLQATPKSNKEPRIREQASFSRMNYVGGSLDARRRFAAKVTEAEDWDLTILEAILPIEERTPLARIEAVRRTIVRSYLTYVATLKALQDERRTFDAQRTPERTKSS